MEAWKHRVLEVLMLWRDVGLEALLFGGLEAWRLGNFEAWKVCGMEVLQGIGILLL